MEYQLQADLPTSDSSFFSKQKEVAFFDVSSHNNSLLADHTISISATEQPKKAKSKLGCKMVTNPEAFLT